MNKCLKVKQMFMCKHITISEGNNSNNNKEKKIAKTFA